MSDDLLLAQVSDDRRARIAELERQLAAVVEERDCWKDGAETLAMQVKDLERDVNQWVKNSAVSQRRIETLERQLAEARAALDLVLRESNAIARGVLQNIDLVLQEVRAIARAAVQNDRQK